MNNTMPLVGILSLSCAAHSEMDRVFRKDTSDGSLIPACVSVWSLLDVFTLTKWLV